MKKSYTVPTVFSYGEVADVVQYALRPFGRDFWFLRRYWLPWGPI